MTDFFICDLDEVNMNNVRENCFSYLFEKNYDAEVYGFSDIDSAKDNISKTNILLSCFVECGEPIDRLIDSIRAVNKDNYVVIMANDVDDVIKYTNPVIRPVGCLFRPASESHVRRILDEIESATLNSGNNQIISFKIKSKEYYVNCENVIMIEAANKKIILYTDSQEFEFYDSMDNLVQKLPKYFFRVHKSYIVNMYKVKEVDYKNMEITLEDELVADLSRSNKSEFMAYMTAYKEAT